jgi:hypothetical protein
MPHGKNPGWESGNHWVVCDVCGFEYRQSEMRKRWDGLITCRFDWEIRHPQEFIRGVADDTRAKGFVRPRPADVFIGPQCSIRSSTPGVAIPGCAIPGTEGSQIPFGTF